MRLRYKNLLIRLATEHDAEYLCKYWHASGWDISLEEAREMLATGKEQHMIELDGRIIGDIHYGEIDEKTVEIGIFIRDENERGKGYGTTVFTIYADTLFSMRYERIRLATSVDDKRMRSIAENKFNLVPIIHENAYQKQSGTYESYAEYFLKKDNWPDELKILSRTYDLDKIEGEY